MGNYKVSTRSTSVLLRTWDVQLHSHNASNDIAFTVFINNIHYLVSNNVWVSETATSTLIMGQSVLQSTDVSCTAAPKHLLQCIKKTVITCAMNTHLEKKKDTLKSCTRLPDLVGVEFNAPLDTIYWSFRRRSSQPITWLILTNKTVQENTDKQTQ